MEGYPKSRIEEGGSLDGAPPVPQDGALPGEIKYQSDDPIGLANFLQNSDVRLIRAEFIWHLCNERRLLPRRQEAHEFFDGPSGRQSALVTHEEVQKWAKGETEALICSISHCWESREHPDPCGYQLGIIAGSTWWYALAYKAPIWLFLDYTSLFQFKRSDEQDNSFGEGMKHMHLLYSHEYTMTLGVQSLTPKRLWEELEEGGHTVLIYHAPTGAVKEVRLQELTRNCVEYLMRGWCEAELQWSSTRSDGTSHQRIDQAEEDAERDWREIPLKGKVPLTPEEFQKQMQSLEFTHRSDTEAVFHLQKVVFLEKVTTCKHPIFSNLDDQGVRDLMQLLPYYKYLESFSFANFDCEDDTVQKLCEWLKERLRQNALTKLVIELLGGFGGSPEVQRGQAAMILEAVAEVLPGNSSLSQVHIKGFVSYSGDHDPVRPALQALAKAMPRESTVSVCTGSTVSSGADRWLEPSEITSQPLDQLDFKAVSWLRHTQHCQHQPLHLDRTRARRPPVRSELLVRKLMRNSAWPQKDTKLYLHEQNLGDAGAEAVAQMLKGNPRLNRIFLSENEIGDAGATALAEAIKENKTVTKIVLSGNEIGDAGAMALAEAIEENRTVRFFYLSENKIGDEGAIALAKAIKGNKAVTEIHLNENKIGDAGKKALDEVRQVKQNVEVKC